MTPERLNKLAEMIEHDEVTFREGREIAAYLRECAKAEPDDCATPIPHDELCAKLTQHDEPVGVARTNAMLKQGDTFCVFELGSVPEGTKLYTRPQPAKVTPETAVVPDEKFLDLVAATLFAAGWRDTCDGQWAGLKECLPELAAMLKGEK